MTTKPLTVTDATRLATIIEAAIHNWTVARLMPASTLLVVGTARCVGDQNGCTLSKDEDIRDGYLRVTTDGGFEAFWPIAELIPEVGTTFIAPYER